MGQYDSLWNEATGQNERSAAVKRTGERTRAIRGQFDDLWEEATRPTSRPDPIATSAAVARSANPQAVEPTSTGVEYDALMMTPMGQRDSTPRVALPGSVFNNMPNPARARAIEDVGAPLSIEGQRQVQAAYDRATPERRAAMSARPDFVGAASRALDRKYEQAGPAATYLGQRREDRADQLIRQGSDPESASALSAMGKSVLDVGSAEETPFDFERAQFYRDNPNLASASRIATGVSDAYSGALDGFGLAVKDALGIDTAEDRDRLFKEQTRDMQNSAEVGQAAGARKNFEGAVTSIATQLPWMAAGVVTGSGIVPLAAMVAQSWGESYKDGFAAGLSPTENAIRSSLFAAFEGLGEGVGLGRLFKTFNKSLADVPTNKLTDEMALYVAKQVPGEVATTTGQFITDKLPSIGLNQDATLKDYLNQVGDTILSSVMQGGLMVGGTKAGAAIRDGLATDAGTVSRAIQSGVDSSEFDKRAIDAEVISSMRGDPTSIDPRLTTRGSLPAKRDALPAEQLPADAERLPADAEQIAAPKSNTQQKQTISNPQSVSDDEELLRRGAAAEKVYDEDGNEITATAVNTQNGATGQSTAVDTAVDTSIPIGDPGIWEPSADLPAPESYVGIEPTTRASQQKVLDDIVASPQFQNEGLTEVKLAEPDEIGQSKYDSLRQIVRTYKKLFNTNIILADFGEAPFHGYFDAKSGNVVLNVRSADLTEAISHEAFHAFEKKHADLFAPIYATAVQLAVPQSMVKMFSAYGLLQNNDGLTDLGKVVNRLVANPADQAARADLAAALSDPKNALARSELIAHMVGQASTPAMYAELVRRSGSASKANKIIQTLTEFLNGLYQKLFGRTVDYVGGPNGIKQIQKMMNDIHNEVQARTAQARVDARAARNKPAITQPTATATTAVAEPTSVAAAQTPNVAVPSTASAAASEVPATTGRQKVEAIKAKAKQAKAPPVEAAAATAVAPVTESRTPPTNNDKAEQQATPASTTKQKGGFTRKQAEDKLDDLAIDPETKKSQVMALARKMIGAGLMPADELRNLEQISKDRDMGPEDLISEMEPYVREDVNEEPRGNFSKKVIGGFETETAKNGSMKVAGDVATIRSALPEGVVGRPTDGGLLFTTSDAPRVRAALEGRKLGYGRQGAVLEDLPMRDGKFVGAPEKFNTPGTLPALRRILRKLADEGAAGRFWYENSSKAVLRFVGGDVQEARKFVALLAIYSPQAKVDANSTFALRAWAQYKAGQPISVKTEVQDEKAREAMSDVDKFWSGEKTGNFYLNLLRMIDPATEGKQGATIDMWMMRAGQYANDAPTETQYAFMENETNRIAAALGWEPQQVQAAIWVAMKARMEDAGVKKATERTSEENGWIRFDYKTNEKGKKVKKRVIVDEQAHRDNWLKHAFNHKVTQKNTTEAKFDFEDGVKRHIGQVSFEARPGRTTGVLPGIHTAPYAQQMEFQLAVQRAFYDENGNDLLAQRLGLLVESNDILAPGVWQGEVSPSNQKLVAMAPNAGKAEKNSIDPAQKSALDVYSAVAGLVARQEGVGYHRPFYSATKRDSNGLDIDIGRPINPVEAADLERAIGDWMVSNDVENWADKFAIISSPNGVRLVNFGAVDNPVLQTKVMAAAAGVLPDHGLRLFASDGDMVGNKWSEYPDGQDYIQRIRAEGRSDVLEWVRDILAPRVQAVFDEYSKKYGWGDPGRVPDGLRSGGRGDEGNAEGNFSRALQYEAQVRGDAPVFSDRPIQPEAASFVGYHYSGVRRATLDGKSYGSATSRNNGKEFERVMTSRDWRLRNRLYFYTAPMAEIPRSEPVVTGAEIHKVDLLNIFDPRSDDDRVSSSRDFNLFEASVIDAGYDGYMSHGLGMVVLLNTKPVAVQYLGTRQQLASQIGINPAATGALKINFPARSYIGSDGMLTKRPDVFLSPAQFESVKKAAPSLQMEYGEYKIKPEEKQPANRALEGVGSDFRFSRQIETPQIPVVRIDPGKKKIDERFEALQSAANKVANGEMTPAEYGAIANSDQFLGSIAPYDFIPAPATDKEAVSALLGNKKAAWNRTGDLVKGDSVGLRLDIPAYKDHGVWVNSIHPKGKETRYSSAAALTDATFPDAGSKALNVAKGLAKSPFARIEGKWLPITPEAAVQRMKEVFDDPAWTQVGYNPLRHSYFFDRKTGNPVTSADEVVQIGPLVLAKNATIESPDAVDANGDRRFLFSRQIESPEFKRWFGDSKIVNDDGTPKVMYHGTARDIAEFQPKQANAIYVTASPRFAEQFADASQQWKMDHLDQFMTPEQIEKATNDAIASIKRRVKNPKQRDLEIKEVRYTKDFENAVRPMLPSGENIMPLFVRAERPFDYENPNHIERVLSQLAKGNLPPWALNNPASYADYYRPQIESGAWPAIESEDVQAAIRAAGFDGFYIKEGGVKNLAVYEPTQLKSAIGNNGEFATDNPDIRFSRLIQIAHDTISSMNRKTPLVIGRGAQKLEDIALGERIRIIREVYQELPPGYNLPVPTMISSNAMRLAKMPHQTVTWSVGTLDKVLFSKHAADFDGITAAEINRSMRDPVAILKSNRADDEFDIITDIVRTNEEGKTGPVVIVVKTNAVFSPKGLAPLKHTAVKSAYIRPIGGKDNVAARMGDVVNIRYLELGRAKQVFRDAKGGFFPEEAIRAELRRRRIPDWVNVVGEIGDRYVGPVEDMPLFSRALTKEEREVESNFRKDLRDNYESKKAEYWRDSPGTLDVDKARDLSPEYKKEPSKYSAAVHEPASDFIKQLYAEQLSSMPKGSIVLFSAGGGGSGKGYILGGFAADLSRAADLVYDTTMSGFESGQRRIQAAIDAGHKVSVVLVYRDPVAALDGAIGRAAETGRVVPISVMAKDHAAGRDAVKRLVEYYDGNPSFSAVAVDNNGATPRYVSIDQVEQIDENDVLEDLYDELDRQSQNPQLAGVVAAFRAASPVRPVDRMGVGRSRRGEVAEGEDPSVRVREGQASGRNARENQGGQDGLLSRKILTQGDRFSLPERSVKERISNKLANEVSRVEDIQKDVVRQGGILTDKSNVQWAQTRMYRQSAAEVKRFRETKVRPLMQRIARAGIQLDDLAMYLYASHAQLRNEYIASINPQFPDAGSGMTTAEAKQFLTAFRARPDYQTFRQLAKELQSITADTAQVLVNGGLVDQNQVSAWQNTYKGTYVPLKGWEDIDESMKVSHRTDPRVPFAKRALGRGSRAGQIIENILGDYERAHVAVQKNNVRKAFYRFVLDNPDSQLWEPQRIILTKRFNKGAVLSPLAMAQGNVTYSATVDNREGQTVAVRIGGQLKSIWVKDEAMLDDLSQAIDAVDGDTRLAMRTLMGINRALAKSYTALSPAFVLTNATRDLQTALLATGIEKKGGFWRAAKISAQLIPLAWNIWKATRNNEWTAVGNRYRDAYIAMRNAGGEQGFMGFMDLQDRQRNLNQIIEETQNRIRLNPKSWYIESRKMVRAAHDFIMDLNGSIESAARVAAYAEAIKAGESQESAVETAANVTVDFARRGKWTPWISGLWLFANPAIQGARRVASLAFSPKGAAITGGLVTLGYMTAIMSVGATGDDDEPYWDKPDVQDTKLKALLFFDPEGNQYKIPLAYGWGFFVNVGYAIADIQRGKGVGRAAAFLTNSLFQHFSPLGVTDNMAAFFGPTLLDPVIAISTNMTERGRPLMPEGAGNNELPDSERYWAATRGTYTQKVTSWLNEFTGGSSVEPGAISVSPETVNYVRNFVLGGAGQFVMDAASSVYLTATLGGSTAVEKNKVPILKSFYRSKDIKGEQAAFFENSKEAQRAYNEMKAYWGKDDVSTAVQERIAQNGGLAALGKSVASYNKALGNLRKEEIAVIDNKDMSEVDKEASRTEIDQRRKQLYDDFNRMFFSEKSQIEK